MGIKSGTPRRIGLIGCAAFAVMAVPVLAWTTDTGNGGYISGDDFYTDSQASSRAEKRGDDRSDTTKTYVMGGRLKIGYGGKTSVIQILNKIRYTDRQGGYGSQPVAQLAVKPENGKYRFFIVQGAQNCSSSLSFSSGTTVSVRVTFKEGSSPLYEVNGTKCQKSTGRYPGQPEPTHNGRPIVYNGAFYGKLGAYNTAGSTTSAKMTWTRIYDREQ